MKENYRDLYRRDRIEVEHKGEDKELFNWVNVMQPATVRVNSSERYEPNIGAGDSSVKPEYITQWLAEQLDSEFGIWAEDHGIEVVDVESDDVEVYW